MDQEIEFNFHGENAKKLRKAMTAMECSAYCKQLVSEGRNDELDKFCKVQQEEITKVYLPLVEQVGTEDDKQILNSIIETATSGKYAKLSLYTSIERADTNCDWDTFQCLIARDTDGFAAHIVACGDVFGHWNFQDDSKIDIEKCTSIQNSRRLIDEMKS
jgi:hypothetical protein